MSAPAARHAFRLYVAGTAPSSVEAIRNVRELCARELAGRWELEVIDVFQRPDRLAADGIVATPTLVRASPLPIRHVVGDLSDRARLLAALEIGAAPAAAEPPAADAGGPPAEPHWRVLVEALRQGAVLLDAAGRVVYTNPWCAERLAVSAEALLGTPLRARVAPTDRAAFDALLGAGTEATVDAEIQVQGADGPPIPMRVTICPFPETVPPRVVLLLSDLTEERRAAAARRLLWETATEIGRAEDFDEALRDLVRRICAFAGWPAGEAWIREDGRMRRRAVWTADPAAAPLVADEAPTVVEGKGLAGEAWARGAPTWTEELGTPTARAREVGRNGAGAALAVPVAAHDRVVGVLVFFTAARRAEDEGLVPTVVVAVSQVGPTLQRRLAEEAVARALREQRHLVEELEDISRALAHDLRRPLRTIVSFSQLLLDESGPELAPAARGRLEHVVSAALHMGRVIEDAERLLEVPRAVPAPRPFDLGRAARETLARLRARDPSREVVADVARPLRAVTDPALARLVLEELLENAWRFTATRSPAKLRVGVVRRDDERVYFVRDNGVGLEPAQCAKVFEPFVQLGGGTPGTGIGLALVRRAVTRLGGRAWCEGEPDRGATFYFTLGPPP